MAVFLAVHPGFTITMGEIQTYQLAFFFFFSVPMMNFEALFMFYRKMNRTIIYTYFVLFFHHI